jgi:hypothetical protein
MQKLFAMPERQRVSFLLFTEIKPVPEKPDKKHRFCKKPDIA